MRSSALPCVCLLLLASEALAADPLVITQVNVDRPTLHALGVQVLITDDDNRNARIAVRYRPVGGTWKQGMDLFRAVQAPGWAFTLPAQFGGSIFDLTPATSYEIELHATDPDGPVDLTRSLTATTRALPRFDPMTPRTVNVSSAAALTTALSSAAAGDVILLADGVYSGAFIISASGTATNPIVLRGASAAGAVLDGANCSGCNVLEVYGSHVHVERLTMRSATRALRFFGTTSAGMVARRLIIRDVVHGIATGAGQTDAWLCDNDLEGRLVWPWVFDANASNFWDNRGVDVTGDGHVICHNRISGFGDPVVNKQLRARSWDVYGNDIGEAFDGTELDEGEGNVRVFRNRWTNVMAPISIQPSYGGPLYALRNVLMNVPDEQVKLKSLGGTVLPSGAVVLHNTFVSPSRALNLQTPITQYHSVFQNNLFVGPAALSGSRTVDYTAALDDVVFDFNGYYPNGGFFFGSVGGVNRVYANWAAVQSAAVVEQRGVLLTTPIFEAGFVGPTDRTQKASPPEFTLAATSNAVDQGTVLPGINAGHLGAAPDLGALELGCPTPSYGPRPEGQ